MSKNLSAIKKIQVSTRNYKRNRIYKSVIKTLIRKHLEYVGSNPQVKNFDTLSVAYSSIDKAIKKGVIHKNKGARQKAMLARVMKKANIHQ